MIEPTERGPWKFSATAAEIASDCMFAFSQKYELDIAEVPGRALLLGRLLSVTVERYILHCFEHQVPSDVTEIEAIARAVFAEKGQGAGLEILDEVLKVCSFYVEAFNVDIERLAGVEMWLPPKSGEPLLLAGREAYGKVDQLGFDDEGRLAIVTDDKSNWSVWSEDEARRKIQARMYAVLVGHTFPDVEDVEVRFRFIRWGIERVVHFNRAQIELERQKLEALSAMMQKPGTREATPGERCTFCGYVSRCPVFKSARAGGMFIVPTNADEARRVHETVLVLEAALDQRRAALNAFTDAHGPIETRGEHAGHFVRESRRVLTKRFLEWAPANGIDPADWLVVPGRELKRLMKKRRSLEPLTFVVTSTQFQTRRKSDPAEETSAA